MVERTTSSARERQTCRRATCRSRLAAGDRETVAAYGVPSEPIVVEVTETGILPLLESLQPDFGCCAERGIGIHVDDFGTGYSSISLLRDLPINGLRSMRRSPDGWRRRRQGRGARRRSRRARHEPRHREHRRGRRDRGRRRDPLEQGWTHAQGLAVRTSPTAPPLDAAVGDPRTRKVGHGGQELGTSCSTCNLERSVHFYRDVLGWRRSSAATEDAAVPAAAFNAPSNRTHHELLLIEVGRTPPRQGATSALPLRPEGRGQRRRAA